jgi:pyruvate kinase
VKKPLLTKIVATLGPGSEKKETIVSILRAGATIFRFNLKHNTFAWHSRIIKTTQEIAKREKKPIAILLDFPDFGESNSLSELLAKSTEKLSLAAKHQADFLAISFVRQAKEIEFFKKLTKKFSFSAKIVAKIEAKEAIDSFEEILKATDAIMIARGDLGQQIPLEKVPLYQKKIIKRCLETGKPVITATQMLESMIQNPFPTRAEVSDVANAVLDYSDAVMLSAETATGKYPVEAVKMMAKICRFWEEKRPPLPYDFNFEIKHQTAAVCYSAYQLWLSPFCQREKVRAFVVLTKEGFSARMLARLRPKISILALTNNSKTRDQLCLLYSIFPIFWPEKDFYRKKAPKDIEKILNRLKKENFVKKGEKVILIHAEDWGHLGRTNILRTQEVP